MHTGLKILCQWFQSPCLKPDPFHHSYLILTNTLSWGSQMKRSLCYNEAGDMAQWVTYFLQKHENMISNPQLPCWTWQRTYIIPALHWVDCGRARGSLEPKGQSV